MPDVPSHASANIRRFIAFRVLFNARYYYPIFAILFLDFGIGMDQFALLNVIWAVSIVLLEVPSGAIADQVGRKKMVVFAAALMVGELLMICLVPRDAGGWIFPVFVLNRIFSGAAEASASGADEALVYDSLVSENRAEDWPGVLRRLMQFQSGGFFVAMVTGAALYDRNLLQWVVNHLGFGWEVPLELAHRLPLWLTLINAVAALWIALGLFEVPKASSEVGKVKLLTAFRDTLSTGGWILRTPTVLMLILTGMTIDSVVRLFMTLTSSYYRMIELPEASFGLIGSGMALIGIGVPPLAEWMVRQWNPVVNFSVLGATTMLSLVGISLAVPRFGVLVIIPAAVTMSLLGFFLSHYLNATIESERRATVLSFRGLAMNVGYGAIGLLFSALLHQLQTANPGVTEEMIFAKAVAFGPGYFAVALLVLAGTGWLLLCRKKPAGG